MVRKRPLLVETLTAVALIAAPFVLPHLGFSPATVNRILVWGLFGIGFDILFGFTGLLSFGQSTFFGTGGMIAAYLLTVLNFPYVMTAVFVGTIVAAVVGYLIGLIALRRTGIYFAMITVAIAEMFYFIEFNPLSDFTGGENGLPGVPTPVFNLGFTTVKFDSDQSLYMLLAVCYFVGIVLALRIVRSPVGAILSAIRDNPQRAAAVGHNIQAYKHTAFVIAAAYAGFAGGLLGVMQGFMPPEAFTFDTSGQLVMQTAIGGTGTLFGPLVGAAVWLYLSDFFQTTLHLGATWKLVLGLVFVLLVCFLRRGIVGGIGDLFALTAGQSADKAEPDDAPAVGVAALPQSANAAAAVPDVLRRRAPEGFTGPILEAAGLSKRFGGVTANDDINFTVDRGELRGIIGPNGAGKTTFFKMLTCELPPTAGSITFEGKDITGFGVTAGLPARPHQELPGQSAVHAVDGARKHHHRRVGGAARQIPARSVPASCQHSGPQRTGRAYAGSGQSHRADRAAGLGAGLWREAAPGNRAGARLEPEPLAARRAAGRHEPARTGGDGEVA